MAIAIVQTTTGTGTTSPQLTTAFGSSTTAGNFIIAVYGSSTNISNIVTKMTDTQGNTYVKVNSLNSAGRNIDVWYANNIVGGAANVVSATLSNTGTGQVLIAREYSGVALSASFGGANINAYGSGSTTATANAAPQSHTSNSLIVCCSYSSSAVPSAGSGFGNFTTAALSTANVAMEDKSVTASGEYGGTIVNASAVPGVIGVYIFSDVPCTQYQTNSNYQFVRVGNGMSVSEKIR